MSVTYRQLFEKYGVDYSGHRENMRALRREGVKTSFISGGVKLFGLGLVAIFNMTWAWFIILPSLALYSIYYAAKYTRNASKVKRQEKAIWDQYIQPEIDAVVARAEALDLSKLPTHLQGEVYWLFKELERVRTYKGNLDIDEDISYLRLAQKMDEVDAYLKAAP